MASGTRIFLVAAFLSVGVIAGLLLGRGLDRRAEPPIPRPTPVPPAALSNLQESFHEVARSVTPSVVHVTSRTGGTGPTSLAVSEGIGSGLVVDVEGHIITNNHVVDAAQPGSLRVRFVEGREFPARVVGTDSETDLAVLKIDPPSNMKLVPARFSDSDLVRVGDWCLAIGSPFGLSHSVSAGIVSAKHRRAQLSLPYQDFIQTDAAINPGNSGGALVNLRGEIIGINTAIISESRSSDGVGLAISSNLVRWVTPRLIENGRVRRGYLGVAPFDFTQRLVDRLRQEGIGTVDELVEELGLEGPRGVFLGFVEPGSPADRAGLRARDVIVEFDGKPVAGQSDMFFKVAEVSPGTAVRVRVIRDRRGLEFNVDLAERRPVDLRTPFDR